MYPKGVSVCTKRDPKMEQVLEKLIHLFPRSEIGLHDPQKDPRWVHLHQWLELSRQALKQCSMVEMQAMHARIAAEKMHREVIAHIELLEIELEIDDREGEENDGV